jgi:transcriptional regulator with XRE-family HTH domain
MAQPSSLRGPLSEVLRDYRKSAGLSQEELGYRSGLHRTYISQLERGLKSPTLDALESLSAALGTSPHIIIRAAEELHQPSK